jgi:4-hydroxy-2-oxoheptanedioate aldolase
MIGSAPGAVQPVELGVFCVVPSELVVEALATAGFDWICIDCQHGLIGYQAMAAMLLAARLSGTPALVRVAENNAAEIGRALDAGASGVIIPVIESAEEAERAVRAVRYPPRGDRSWGPRRGWQAFDPAQDVSDCYVMLETPAGFDNAAEILSVPGVTGVFVGPSDLAIALGMSPRDVAADEVLRRCDDLLKLALEHGSRVGIGGHSIEQAMAWAHRGFDLISIGRDVSVMTDAFRSRLDAIRRESADKDAG